MHKPLKERVAEMSRQELEELILRLAHMEDLLLTWNVTCDSCGKAWEHAYMEASHKSDVLDVLSRYDAMPREMWEALRRVIMHYSGRA